MQHIVTRYHGPTTNLGTRISATASGSNRRIYIRRETSTRVEDSHRIAAHKLARIIWQNDSYPAELCLMVGYEIDPDTWMWFFANDPQRQMFHHSLPV